MAAMSARFDDRLDFDGDAAWQGSDADRRAGVPAAFAENIGQEIRGAVHHEMRIGEIRDGVDEADHLYEAHDALEIAERRLQLREDVDGAEPRGCAPLVDWNIPARLCRRTLRPRHRSGSGPTRNAALRSRPPGCSSRAGAPGTGRTTPMDFSRASISFAIVRAPMLTGSRGLLTECAVGGQPPAMRACNSAPKAQLGCIAAASSLKASWLIVPGLCVRPW